MKLFFEGWYYKQQANGKTLALIPGRSGDGAFIHVITDDYSFSVPFDIADYSKNGDIRIGENIFSNSGIKLNINRNGIVIKGELKYSGLAPIRGDIMGFFSIFPMECRHEIISMKHDVSGEIFINNEIYKFDRGVGYIEADSGCSFPESYAWVHSNDFDEECSVTAAVARIPFAGFRFWGCICVVMYRGREYRLATYKGVKIIRCENGVIELKQGKYRLVITVKQQNAHKLPAPKSGIMSRFIKESASCPAEFIFYEDDKPVFSKQSKNTSYEYAMENMPMQTCLHKRS